MPCRNGGIKAITNYYFFGPTNSTLIVDRILKQQETKKKAAAEALAKERIEETTLTSQTLVSAPAMDLVTPLADICRFSLQFLKLAS